MTDYVDPNDRTSPRPCAYCGALFEPRPTGPPGETCSRSHSAALSRRRKRERERREDEEARAASGWEEALLQMSGYLYGSPEISLPSLYGLVALREEWDLQIPEVEEYLVQEIEEDYEVRTDSGRSDAPGAPELAAVPVEEGGEERHTNGTRGGDAGSPTASVARRDAVAVEAEDVVLPETGEHVLSEETRARNRLRSLPPEIRAKATGHPYGTGYGIEDRNTAGKVRDLEEKARVDAHRRGASPS